MEFIIYCHTSPSGKRYVGMTKRTLMRRWYQHRWDAKNGSTLPFHRAMRKHGPEAFTHETLETVATLAEANAAELRWIASLKVTDEAFGYNLSSGGETREFHPKTKAIIAEKARARQAALTPEQRRLTALRREAAKTPEERSAVAKARQAAKTPEERAKWTNKGAPPMSKEHRERMRVTGKARFRAMNDALTPQERSARSRAAGVIREAKFKAEPALDAKRREHLRLANQASIPIVKAKAAAARLVEGPARLERKRARNRAWWHRKAAVQAANGAQ